MKPYLSKKLILFLLLFLLLIPFFTQAITIENPLGTESFQKLIEALINLIFIIALAITPIMIIIAAFYFITSAGDPEKVSKAKKIFLYTLLGLAIIFSARAIVGLIGEVFEPMPPPPPWP